MKNKINYLFITLIVSTLIFNSCNNDETTISDDNDIEVATEIGETHDDTDDEDIVRLILNGIKCNKYI